eukprot:UN03263
MLSRFAAPAARRFAAQAVAPRFVRQAVATRAITQAVAPRFVPQQPTVFAQQRRQFTLFEAKSYDHYAIHDARTPAQKALEEQEMRWAENYIRSSRYFGTEAFMGRATRKFRNKLCYSLLFFMLIAFFHSRRQNAPYWCFTRFPKETEDE